MAYYATVKDLLKTPYSEAIVPMDSLPGTVYGVRAQSAVSDRSINPSLDASDSKSAASVPVMTLPDTDIGLSAVMIFGVEPVYATEQIASTPTGTPVPTVTDVLRIFRDTLADDGTCNDIFERIPDGFDEGYGRNMHFGFTQGSSIIDSMGPAILALETHVNEGDIFMARLFLFYNLSEKDGKPKLARKMTMEEIVSSDQHIVNLLVTQELMPYLSQLELEESGEEDFTPWLTPENSTRF